MGPPLVELPSEFDIERILIEPPSVAGFYDLGEIRFALHTAAKRLTMRTGISELAYRACDLFHMLEVALEDAEPHTASACGLVMLEVVRRWNSACADAIEDDVMDLAWGAHVVATREPSEDAVRVLATALEELIRTWQRAA